MFSIKIDILNLVLKLMLHLTFGQRRRRQKIVSFLYLFLVAFIAAGGLFMYGVRASERASGVTSKGIFLASFPSLSDTVRAICFVVVRKCSLLAIVHIY